MYRNIEFVDERNSISLIAEAVAKKFLYKRNLSKDVEVNSSGVSVGSIKTSKDYQLFKFIEQYIPKFLERELINRRESGELRKIVETGIDKRKSELKKDKDALERLDNIVGFFRDTFDDAITEEKNEIRKIIEEKNLKKYLTPTRISKPRKTKARENAELIFPMSEKAYKRTKKIYSGSSLNPEIELLTLTDSYRIKEKIDDPFLLLPAKYREIANDVEDAIINVLKREFEQNNPL